MNNEREQTISYKIKIIVWQIELMIWTLMNNDKCNNWIFWSEDQTIGSFSFWNELGKRTADYIKKKEQHPDWVQPTKKKRRTCRLDWDINTATQLHSNSTL